MKITLINTKGLIIKRVNLGSKTVNLEFRYNSIDDSWYLSIPGLIHGYNVIKGRRIDVNNEGYLIAESDVSKEGFTEITWVEYD